LVVSRIRCWRVAVLAAGLGLAVPAGAAAPAYRSVIDQTGRKVRLPLVIRRIVTLAPSLTEMVYFLGQGGKLVGATQFSTYPASARKVPRVGSYIRINFEAVAMLRPDLVLGLSEINPAFILDKLTRMGLPLYRSRLRTVADILACLRRLGELIGAGPEAQRQVDSLAARVRRVRRAVAGKRRIRVFVEIDHRPLVTVGPGTFTDRLIRLAGGRNVFGRERFAYPRLSVEQVILAQPEVIVILCHQRTGCQGRVKAWQRWRSIPAVREGRVKMVDTDILARPSQRLIDGLEVLARVLHPHALEGRP
jgi:iron complex transport system substrate-binding protein